MESFCYRFKCFIILIILFSSLYAQTGARYLVITPDSFYNTLQPLIEWKYKKGMKPAVYRLSQIGSDSASIRNFIKSCYNTWDIKPEFVVLVGHPGYIPMHYYQYSYYNYYYTDNYYTNMDGDLYNEIIPGRISVKDTNELKTVISKIFVYERYPFTSDPSWFKKGCAIANCDGQDDYLYLSCMRYAESLAVHNGFVHVDTFSDRYGNSASSVINAINDGRIFVLYRGLANNHWYYPFDVNPYSTANGAKLPIVISATCRTVSSNSSPLLGENFLRVGTPSSLRGTVGFYGGTRNTGNAAHLRNAVAIGFLNAIFIEGKRTFGEAGEGGRLRVYEQYGELRSYNNFTCLGDPELNIWTDTPCSLIVQHPDFVPLGYSNFSVNVTDALNSIPVSNAFVCVAGKSDTSTYVLDTTDASGNAYFNIEPKVIDDTLFITVTGKNLKPYEGFAIVKMMNYSYVIYLNSFVNDSVSGNNDGFINPTEEIELSLWVRNIGESTGVNITGILRSDDTCITITDSVKYFGDVAGRDSAFTGEDGYNFSVVHSCPNMHPINFELICRDINDSIWMSDFKKLVYAPEFVFRGATVSGGNGNNTLEPAETVDVVVSLKNQGDAAADSVYAILRCQSPGVSIIDSIGTFGHIGVNVIQDNSLDPFVVSADSGVSTGTVVNFNVVVFSNYCNENFDFDLVVGKKNYYVWNSDNTPASGQNIHTILTNLGYVGDYGTTPASDIDFYSVLFVCAGVYPNNHIIVEDSPEALALTNFLNNGGRIYLEGGDVWFWDPRHNNGHDFCFLFGINAVADGLGNMGPVIGQSGTFTNGMNFSYGGDNNLMDQISPTGSGFLIFRDGDDYYDCGVANDAGTYRTVGTSFELGLLADATPPSTRAALLDSIMGFFGIPGHGVEEGEGFVVPLLKIELGPICPNPFTRITEIRYQIGDLTKMVSLKIYDVTGRLVRQWDCRTMRQSDHVAWQGDDDAGNCVPSGIYFVRLECGEFEEIEKVILLK